MDSRSCRWCPEKAERGDYLLGTVDSWLLYHLTGGEVFRTDLTNASRTQLLNISTLKWESALCSLFNVPVQALPEIAPSGSVFGSTQKVAGVPDGIPIVSMIGDSQAALFGETAFLPGMAKATYGTGTSVMINTGTIPVMAEGGLATAIAWQIADEVTYAIEGIIHTTGAAINWLKDGMMLIDDSSVPRCCLAVNPPTDATKPQKRNTAARRSRCFFAQKEQETQNGISSSSGIETSGSS